MGVDCSHDLFGGVRSGHGENTGMRLSHDVALSAEAAGDDDLTVFRQCFTDGIQRLIDRRIDEAAGIDDDEIGSRVARGDQIAFSAQLRKDAFRIDERFRTAERYESNLGNCR
jgi:hypothetical protein